MRYPFHPVHCAVSLAGGVSFSVFLKAAIRCATVWNGPPQRLEERFDAAIAAALQAREPVLLDQMNLSLQVAERRM